MDYEILLSELKVLQGKLKEYATNILSLTKKSDS
jgi:hypothetical protein